MPCRGAKYCRFVLPILVDVKKRRLCQISLKAESLITIRITPTTPRAVKTSLIVFGILLASYSGARSQLCIWITDSFRTALQPRGSAGSGNGATSENGPRGVPNFRVCGSRPYSELEDTG